MSNLTTTFVLTGGRQGQTVNLGSLPYRFVDGKTELTATIQDMALHARFLEINWQAYPVGHPALEGLTDGQRNIQTDSQQDSQPPVSGDLQPNGEGVGASEANQDSAGNDDAETGDAGTVSAGDGQQAGVKEPEAIANTKLQTAVLGLDPADDTHWTKDGKPAMTAVEKLYGSSGITRADVEAAAPGYNRDKAKAAAE